MREQVLAWLAYNVPASRVNHILRVEQMATQLAVHYNDKQEKAATAALMHDLAKNFPPEKLLEIARIHNLELVLTDVEISTAPSPKRGNCPSNRIDTWFFVKIQNKESKKTIKKPTCTLAFELLVVNNCQKLLQKK